VALSTLKPTTSPRLSVIRLTFDGRTSARFPRHAEPPLKEVKDDIRWARDEVARIEREFRGTVDLTVRWHPWFEVILDTFNAKFPFSFIPCRTFTVKVGLKRDPWIPFPFGAVELFDPARRLPTHLDADSRMSNIEFGWCYPSVKVSMDTALPSIK